MATFTLTLKQAIDLTGGTVDIVPVTYKGISMGTVAQLIDGDIGLAGIPIFDEEYKDLLIGKIVDHFWNREIGFETIDLFKMKMRTRMNEIMPYYNQMYLSTQIEYEALSTIDLRTETESTNKGTEDATSTATGASETQNKARAVSSQTPQTMLSGNEDYASNATDTNSTSNTDTENDATSSSVSENEAEGNSTVKGYQGTPADLIMRFRDSLINVDLMVIRDLEELFMLVFDNGDSYTQKGYGYDYY